MLQDRGAHLMVQRPAYGEDWDKLRSNGTHLTDAECARIMRAHRARERAVDVARELGCSTRTINVHFAKIEGRHAAKEKSRVARFADQPDVTKHFGHQICVVALCLRSATEGRRTCERHEYRPPAGVPLSRLMGARA